MLDFLDNPVPSWLFYGFAIVIIFELRRYQKKTVVGKVKKNKILDKLNEDVFVFPKQEEIDLSKYGDDIEDYLTSFNIKNTKTKSRKDINIWEVDAKIIHDFRYYQQYLNKSLPNGFIAEQTLNDLNVASFEIFRGRIKIANIVVSHDHQTDDVNGMKGDRPSAGISAKLYYTELLNYGVLKRLLLSLASAHEEDSAELNNLQLKVQIEECITEHLWKLQQRNTINQYATEDTGYESEMIIDVEFCGTYSNYLRYVKNVGAEKMYSLERKRIEYWETEWGYKRVEKD